MSLFDKFIDFLGISSIDETLLSNKIEKVTNFLENEDCSKLTGLKLCSSELVKVTGSVYALSSDFKGYKGHKIYELISDIVFAMQEIHDKPEIRRKFIPQIKELINLIENTQISIRKLKSFGEEFAEKNNFPQFTMMKLANMSVNE